MQPAVNPKNPSDPDALRTDPTSAANFLQRRASAVKLKGQALRYLPELSAGKMLEAATEDVTPTAAVLGYAVFGAITNALINDPKATIGALKVS